VAGPLDTGTGMFKYGHVVSEPKNPAMPWLVCPGLLEGLYSENMTRSNQVMYVHII